MAKRITANLYTKTKTVWKNHEHTMVHNKDGTLFSQGRYKTKIFPSDLPEWFVEGAFYRQQGYLSAYGVKRLVYKPNLIFNHMFKDDFLYISYDKPILSSNREDSVFVFDGFDEYIWGWAIVTFLKAAEKYSGYDISDIKAEIEEKRKWFERTHPTSYQQECNDRKII